MINNKNYHAFFEKMIDDWKKKNRVHILPFLYQEAEISTVEFNWMPVILVKYCLNSFEYNASRSLPNGPYMKLSNYYTCEVKCMNKF